ncbi:MAG TPA: class I SAM-dependent methyltransferase, partial [Anaerolineaceae bacterium]|nr:class I SAM-dependent methyltransferase [Anaerolineaceae bacterium]
MAQPAISDPWESGDPYERYVGRWSRQVAPRFLAWLNPAAGLRWLDLGCGTGAISAAVLEQCEPALVIGVEPSLGFIRAAREKLPGAVGLARGLATA